MNIVGICACTAGIAHTYMAREKILQAAKARGDGCFIETQGTIGPENVLTPEQIKQADVVILAVDVKVSGEERFAGKPLVRVGTATVIKDAKAVLDKVQAALDKR
ncbi:MAG TPA: PTS fructose transporter subunit IIB [Candidatus Enterocloster excrementipullorum]|uniref:PTS fructose transporter subunit IIB n=1 Tax=Candidatus Enterocloster excrementipullorum TaxID=2838559 RepID=A0A9D2MYT4_9FIRM|nr:PTS fructose transporter subunit IIB [Candidatus Enterocloster excrementipullorum]